ncbi:MAG TPA: NifB/NifX family molybdenum-iron cluster-binding protein [Clostridia bacterium]|nr:NifB/NifX family molybdenum-iron cluster-binding protein [Clostridia bacterium]
MRIAVATEGDFVAAHFGRCPSYTIVDIEGDKINNKEVIPNPGHEPGFLPAFLSERGVNVIICGGMGPRAQGLFAERGVNSIMGITGEVEEAIDSFLAGDLKPGTSLCNHESRGPGGGHGHDHPHGCC